MKFFVLTLFPEMIENIVNTSIIGRAKNRNLIDVELVNIRDFANNKHGKVDDYPYGGGAGMLMQCEPIHLAYKSICSGLKKAPKCIYTSPQGKTFKQSMAKELAKEENIVILCGHYEGVDERVLELISAEPVSVGDYVLTGGELPAALMIDAISRMVEGVLTNEASASFESFEGRLLEYPQYTRPEVYEGKRVPEVLLSGHHKNIERWQKKEAMRRTMERRKDLLDISDFNAEELKIFYEIVKEEEKSSSKNKG